MDSPRNFSAKTIKINMLKTYIRICYNYWYDLSRFLKGSSIKSKDLPNKVQLAALITMDYHRLEKGMALADPRIGFGVDVVERLKTNVPLYIKNYGYDQTINVTLNVIGTYCERNAGGKVDVQALAAKASEWSKLPTRDHRFTDEGGVLEVTRDQIMDGAGVDLKKFFDTRFSIRNFGKGDIPLGLIERAVVMAQKTPSVCNRQSSKVYVYTTEEDKKKVLGLQTGNRGFGEGAARVLIVTSDSGHFTDIGERNQGWIDGGMFSMSLVYALHSLGIGSCCLNWSVGVGKDKALKAGTKIPDTDLVIMMIAIGWIPEKLNVAQSPRKNLEEILIIE